MLSTHPVIGPSLESWPIAALNSVERLNLSSRGRGRANAVTAFARLE
jgi:hypothetical protein